jgi:hypothetical protein
MNSTNIVLGKFRKCYPAKASNMLESLNNDNNGNISQFEDFNEVNNNIKNHKRLVSNILNEQDSFYQDKFQNDLFGYSKLG